MKYVWVTHTSKAKKTKRDGDKEKPIIILSVTLQTLNHKNSFIIDETKEREN